MRIDVTRLTSAIRRLDDRYEERDPVLKALYVSDEGGNWHNVRFLNPDMSYGPVSKVRGRVVAWAGVHVRVSKHRKAWGPTDWVIIGPDETVYGSEPAPYILEPHGWTHGWNQPDETNNLYTWQIYPLRVQQVNVPNQTVNVLPGVYYAGGGFHQLDAVTNVNLAAFIAALGPGERQYLVLSIDALGAINVTPGAPSVLVLQAEDIPNPPVGERGLAAVEVRAGDTEITDDRITADIRFLAGGTAGGMALDDLSDVDAPAPDDTDALVWNAAEGEWEPMQILTDANGDVLSDMNGDVIWG